MMTMPLPPDAEYCFSANLQISPDQMAHTAAEKFYDEKGAYPAIVALNPCNRCSRSSFVMIEPVRPRPLMVWDLLSDPSLNNSISFQRTNVGIEYSYGINPNEVHCFCRR